MVEERPARVTRRRGETRLRLLAAAFDVFAELGFGRATVDNVCERAGFTRGAFYSNFTNLDELFFALYTDYAAAMAGTVEAVFAATAAELRGAEAAARTTVDTLVDRVVAALPANRERFLINTEFAVHALRHPDVARALAAHRQALRSALIPVLELGLRATGAVVTGDRLDAIARAVVAVSDGMALQELLEPAAEELPALRRTLLTAVITATGGAAAPAVTSPAGVRPSKNRRRTAGR